jgi:endo-1,4-beta-mannosidase
MGSKVRNDFLIGINYWPPEKAMYWWFDFDPALAKRDFARLAEFRFELVRIFLLWEDFQPEINRISVSALNHLVRVASLANDAGLKILPTFFCGHMSGVNWLPPWMLEPKKKKNRFPIFSGGGIQSATVRNFYKERELRKAQKLLLHETSNALQGHPAVWGWDLGNEPSNLALPSSKDDAKGWLEEMVSELKRRDGHLPITLGLHQGDLEKNTLLGPRESAPFCDVLSMHAYPGYAPWGEGPLDERIPLFLALLTQWLGGKEVILEEFGVPFKPSGGIPSQADEKKLGDRVLVSEEEGEWFYRKVLESLREYGIQGALPWCYGDYDPILWDTPPLKDLVHERYFGVFHWYGAPKKPAEAIARVSRRRAAKEPLGDWIDMDPEEFYRNPRRNIKQLYRKFKGWIQNDGKSDGTDSLVRRRKEPRYRTCPGAAKKELSARGLDYPADE